MVTSVALVAPHPAPALEAPKIEASIPDGVILGQDDLTPAGRRARNVPPTLQPAAWAQGALQAVKVGVGGRSTYTTVWSVTHIGGDYAITAGHCLDPCRTCAVVEDEPMENSGWMVDWDAGAVLGSRWVVADNIVWSLCDESTDFAILHVRPH